MSKAAKLLPTSPTSLIVGCVGGGQLGRMMALDAPRLNIEMKFLDGGGGSCPAAQVVGIASGGSGEGGGESRSRIVEGKLHDEEKLRELSKGCDIVTMEIEHVGVDGLARLEKEGVNVQPSSRVVGIIQDKFVQKVRLMQWSANRFVIFAFCFYVMLLHHDMMCSSTRIMSLQKYDASYHVSPPHQSTGILLQTLHSTTTLHQHPHRRINPNCSQCLRPTANAQIT